jgi:WXG100 family type VII secretion target
MVDVSILGRDAVRGQPDSMAAVGDRLDRTADDLQKIRSALMSDSLGGAWEGQAAEAFQDLVDDLPKDLGKAHRSFDEAARAVKRYATKLRDAHDTARSLAAQLETAQRQQAATAATASRAGQAANSAIAANSGLVDPALKQQKQQAYVEAMQASAVAGAAHEAAMDRVAEIKRLAHENRQDLERASRHAREALQEASHHGMRNTPWSSVKRHGGSKVWHVSTSVLSHGAHAIAGLFVDAAKIFGRLARFLTDPSWKHFSELLDSVAAILTIAAIVVAIVAVVAAVVFSGGTVRAFKHDPEVGAVDLAADAVAVGLAIFGIRAARANSAAIGAVDADIARAQAWKPHITQSATGKPHLTRVAKRVAELEMRKVPIRTEIVRGAFIDAGSDRGLAFGKDLGNDYLPRPFGHPFEFQLKTIEVREVDVKVDVKPVKVPVVAPSTYQYRKVCPMPNLRLPQAVAVP